MIIRYQIGYKIKLEVKAKRMAGREMFRISFPNMLQRGFSLKLAICFILWMSTHVFAMIATVKRIRRTKSYTKRYYV